MGDKSAKGLLAIRQLATEPLNRHLATLFLLPIWSAAHIALLVHLQSASESKNCHFGDLGDQIPESHFLERPAAAFYLPFYWAMIRCTASCKDVPILSPLLTRGPCPNIGQVSRQRFMYLQFTLNTVATILQHNNLFVRFLRPFRRNLAGDDKWFKYCWWSSRHMCC